MSFPPLFGLNRPLRGADVAHYRTELQHLQGNILKGHGRSAAAYVFLSFRPGTRDDAGRFVRTFANVITSTADQAVMTERFRATGDNSSLFTGFFLSAGGYRFLLGEAGGADPLDGFSAAFRGGMKSANARFMGQSNKDPSPSAWEPAFQREIHAMVLFAHADAAALGRPVADLRTAIGAFTDITVESGKRLVGSTGASFEHFGYVDAISQPIFFDDDLPPRRTNWDPSAGPNLVLVRDPLGRTNADCGSYLVFRKLEQNVSAFRAARRAYARALGFAGADGDKAAGALMVGRFEDGTPRAMSDRSLGTPDNDFDYRGDHAGLRGCPLDGHIRVVNPRSDASGAVARTRRIVRRGLPYGDAAPAGEEASPVVRGLLFQCYQADLVRQFEYLHSAPFAGMDKMMRAHVETITPNGTIVPFDGLVTLRGGEYFFAPSINVLKHWP
jgi:deferrochelatase/peroxidase EfeB